MSFSNVYEDKILNHLFSKGSPLTPAYPLSLGLCTSDPGEAATGSNCNEVPNTYSYARVVTVAGNWNIASGGEITNADTLVFPEASGSWGQVTHFVLFDSQIYGMGNVVVYGTLDTPRTITAGYTPRFEPGQLIVNLD